MKRNHNLKRIKAKRSYSFTEAAQTVGVHVRTIQAWHKQGLPVIEGLSPFRVMGSDLKAFIAEMKANRRIALGKGQFYCFSCRKAVYGTDVLPVSNMATIGKNKKSYTLKGKCSECGGIVNLFCSGQNHVIGQSVD